MLRVVLVALLFVLAGCQVPGSSVTTEIGPTTDGARGTDATQTAATNGSAGGASGPAGSDDAPDDPGSDRLGWENGYWHNASIDVTTADGLNESELDVVVSRAMARIEVVRQLEFEERVPVTVIDRSVYRTRSGGNFSTAFQRFDNAKFEALFLIGERNDSIETQEATRGESVLGYYSTERDAIVIVSDSETPRLDGEGTLAHELVHALQDQHFDLTADEPRTRDALQGRNGLIEGDASFTERRYQARCGSQWQCLSSDGSGTADAGGGGGAGHFGIQFMMYFPYSDGAEFVRALHEEGGWTAVDDAYSDVPDGATEVIDPGRYSEWEPAPVDLRDRSTDEWERVRPPGRLDSAVPGQSAIAASFAYTLADEYNQSAVVRPTDVVNYRADGSIDPDDPFEYGVSAASGWAGGRMHVYHDGDELAYVWKTRWENASEAREFADAWRTVIRHWGGESAGENEMVIRDGEFADAFAIRRDGNTVTVVNAPERADLSGVHDA